MGEGDYGGGAGNIRLSHPDREEDWARLSPSVFRNRRYSRKDWTTAFDLWKPPAPAASYQDSIARAILDVVWFEVIRGTPLAGDKHSTIPAHQNRKKPDPVVVHEELRTQVDRALGAYKKPAGVVELSTYDALEALAQYTQNTPLKVDSVNLIQIRYQYLPLDLEHWRDWIARRGPVVALIWVDDGIREQGKPDVKARRNLKPGAVVVAGYNHVFEKFDEGTGDSSKLAEDNYTLRPAFEFSQPQETPAALRGMIKVDGSFAPWFLEGFGIEVTLTP